MTELIKKEEAPAGEKVVEKIVEKPFEVDGKPVTAEDYKALQGKVDELAKIATDNASTTKERDDAIKALTEMQTRQETLQQIVSGKQPSGKVTLEKIPDYTIYNEKTGEHDWNPDRDVYDQLVAKTLIELQAENRQLKQVSGATGVQNVNHGNAITRREFKDKHGLNADELDAIVELGVARNIIPSYKVGDKAEPVIDDIEQLEEARTLKMVNDLREASGKNDMKAVEDIVRQNFVPKQQNPTMRLGGGGAPDKTDAEKKFQLMATGKVDIKDFAETEINELIRSGHMSQHTKDYRWRPAQKT